MNRYDFAIVGGDERYWILAGLLAAENFSVCACGFELMTEDAAEVDRMPLPEAVSQAESVILPLPATKDGETVCAQFSKEPICFDELSPLLGGKRIFAGQARKLVGMRPELAERELTDYSVQEAFLLKNAYLTAEALLMLSINTLRRTLLACPVLITGFGRIGRYTAQLLSSAGADVYCATHTADKHAIIADEGFTPLTYSEAAAQADSFELVINTADALVVSGAIIRRLKNTAVILEAASLPGGIDSDAAEFYGIKIVPASGLPGKYSPITAAEIIRDTVLGSIPHYEGDASNDVSC